MRVRRVPTDAIKVVDKIIQHIASEQKGWERHHGRAKAGPYLQAINRLRGVGLLDYFGKDDNGVSTNWQ